MATGDACRPRRGQSGTATPGGWTVAHLDVAAGPSVVGVRADGAPMIWGPGPGRHAYLGLGFSGRDPTSDQRRSNVSGIGARVAVRTESRWTAFETTRLASGPGQSLQPMTIGLGGAARADFVALTWSDGVFQTEMRLEGGQLHRIGETQRQLSSCPVLFAWDGTRFRFVTDVLGVGGIGFFERPGVYSEPLPRENVLLPDGAVAAERRRVSAEDCRADGGGDLSGRRVARGLRPAAGMADGARRAQGGERPGADRRPDLLSGGTAADRGGGSRGRRRHRARCAAPTCRAVGPSHPIRASSASREPFAVTLTFGQALDRGPGRPVLLVDGWVEYPYAQTVFAAWQAGVAYEAPTLEARDASADGTWWRVSSGIPPACRGRWPIRCRRFRAAPRRCASARPRRSTGIASPWSTRSRRPTCGGTCCRSGRRRWTRGLRASHHGTAAHAALRRRARAPLADTRHPRGWYTEFGRVEALVAAEDDAVAIFGPGEAVDVDFEAPTTSAPAGWTRRSCSKHAVGARTWISTRATARPSSRCPAPTPPRAAACIRASIPGMRQAFRYCESGDLLSW